MIPDWLAVPCDKPTCRADVGRHCLTNTGNTLPKIESHVARRRAFYQKFPDQIPEFHPLRRHPIVTLPTPDQMYEKLQAQVEELEAQIDKLRAGVRLSALDRALEHHRRAWSTDKRATEQEIRDTTEAFEKILLGETVSVKTQISDLLNDSGLWDDAPMDVSSQELLRLLEQIQKLVET